MQQELSKPADEETTGCTYLDDYRPADPGSTTPETPVRKERLAVSSFAEQDQNPVPSRDPSMTSVESGAKFYFCFGSSRAYLVLI
jgi:hypothetical protein